MKKTTKLYTTHLMTMLVLAIAALALRIVAYFGDLDYSSGYFTDKLCINIGNALAIAACLISFLFAFLNKKETKYRLNMHTPLLYIPAGITSVALIFFAASEIYYLVKLPGAFLSVETFSDNKNLLLFAVSILALVSIAYFMIESIFDKQRSPERGAFGIVFVLFLALLSAYTYFSDNMHMNSLIKITDQIAYVFAAVFFLYECRVALDREKWTGYIAFGGIAALLSAYSSIPALLVYFVKGELISRSLAENMLMLSIFLLVVSRLIMLLSSPEDKKSETVEAIDLMSSARRAEMEASALARVRALENIKEENSSDDEPVIENVLDDNYKLDIDSINSTDTEKED